MSIYILYLLQNLNFSVHSINILLGIYFYSSSFISILHKRDGKWFYMKIHILLKKEISNTKLILCNELLGCLRSFFLVSYMWRSLFYLQSVITEIVLFLLKNISFSSQHFFSFNLCCENCSIKITIEDMFDKSKTVYFTNARRLLGHCNAMNEGIKWWEPGEKRL